MRSLDLVVLLFSLLGRHPKALNLGVTILTAPQEDLLGSRVLAQYYRVVLRVRR